MWTVPLPDCRLISEKDAATSMLTTLAGSSQINQIYWLTQRTGVSYPVSVQTPQRDISTR